MRRRHVSEIERRILAQQNDVEFGQISAARRAEREVIARLVAHLKRLDRSEQLAVEQRQTVRRVVRKSMPARLRLEQHGEGGVALDVDPGDRIHLHRDVQAHGRSLRLRFG
jgi:hypothetical protein